MRKIVFILLSIVPLITLSTSSIQLNNQTFYCPEQITCDDQGECSFVSEHKNFFKYLSIPNKVEVGIYKFYKTEYVGSGGAQNPSNWPNEQFTYNKCSYKSPYNLLIDLISYNGNNIQPLIENWTSWSSESYFKKNCFSNMSSKCPFMKNEGIIFERFMRNERGEIMRYDDSKNTPIAIDFKLDSWGNTNPAHTLWHVSHDTLIKYCKSLSPCKLTIHYGLQTDRIYHKSNIVIDVVNNDHILDIVPLDGKKYLTVKVNPIVPNTIIFEYKDEKQKTKQLKKTVTNS